MKKIDFTNLEFEDVDGKKLTANIAKQLGNQLYMQGQNVEECELGRDIYHSTGEMELTDEQARMVLKVVKGYPWVSRSVIENILA